MQGKIFIYLEGYGCHVIQGLGCECLLNMNQILGKIFICKAKYSYTLRAMAATSSKVWGVNALISSVSAVSISAYACV